MLGHLALDDLGREDQSAYSMHAGVPIPGLRPQEDTVLERCLESPSTSRRLRTGLAGPFLDGFAKSMFAAG